MVALSTIKSRYYAIARRLGAPKRHVMFSTHPTGFGDPHVEKLDDAYAYVVLERGHEIERRVTQDPDELLYWLVSDLTWSMASEYELSHRSGNADFRRLLFRKHLELLSRANPKWSEAKRIEYDSVLRAHPFSDTQG